MDLNVKVKDKVPLSWGGCNRGQGESSVSRTFARACDMDSGTAGLVS